MVLNDIIEQAAGRHSRASDHGGMFTDKSRNVILNAFLIKIQLCVDVGTKTI